eukprot:TRINITY_DN41754_c0_g1_i3.p2 TRINITY_DN41754_c0_g1~~TRINITY_DN41754_c0_g1_i3.p2  ORF type:complete len:404 (-),score=137.43 TRINITY_DN41754_c0_g1_i3:533-1744(-)
MLSTWWCFLGCLVAARAGEAPLLHILDVDDEMPFARKHTVVMEFMKQHAEPRHAVGLAVVKKGSKQHELLEELAKDRNLNQLLVLGASFSEKTTSLVVHAFTKNGTTPAKFEGKWNKKTLRPWLQDVAYPLVNEIKTAFPTNKYLTVNPFGVVLVVKAPDSQTQELVETLQPFAEEFKDKLKFSFFTRSPASREQTRKWGIWTDDELVVFEKPAEVALAPEPRGHSVKPPSKKYRLEGVTAESLAEFFGKYRQGSLPQYYWSSQKKKQAPAAKTVRELSGWDFVPVTSDSKKAVLVFFSSANCGPCREFEERYEELGRLVEKSKRQANSNLKHVVLGRIDQSSNEHPEVIKGTPHLLYYPRARKKKQKRKPVEVSASKTAEDLLEFLEEQAEEESHGEPAGEL